MTYDPKPMQNYESAQEGFEKNYEGNPPWEIGRPQAPFLSIADQLLSPVLDAGCGTGNTSLFLAARGLEVTGIDFVEEALRRARTKATEWGVPVRFLSKDAMTLGTWDERFASVIDSGLFHIYAQELRQRYVQGLAHVLKPGGYLYLLSFTDEAPEGGVSRQELQDAFSEGWEVESMQAVIGEVNPEFAAEHPDAYADGGPKMWFAVIRRVNSL